MKTLLFTLILGVMIQSHSNAQDGKAKTERTTFNRSTSISGLIEASPTAIWELITHAKNIPTWTVTIISIDGEIGLGNKIRLKSSLDSSRTFKLKVKQFEPQKKLVWGDSKGERTFLLESIDANKTRFTMTESIGGLMFPLYAKYIPAFDENFEQFFRDLKAIAKK